jgi:hypothetical protein
MDLQRQSSKKRRRVNYESSTNQKKKKNVSLETTMNFLHESGTSQTNVSITMAERTSLIRKFQQQHCVFPTLDTSYSQHHRCWL